MSYGASRLRRACSELGKPGPAAGAQSPGNAGGKGANPASAFLDAGVWWPVGSQSRHPKAAQGILLFISPKVIPLQKLEGGGPGGKGGTVPEAALPCFRAGHTRVI